MTPSRCWLATIIFTCRLSRNILHSRMRDLHAIDSRLLNELKSCRAKEYDFLPREAGLRMMESAPTEVTHRDARAGSAVRAGSRDLMQEVVYFQNHSGVSAKCRDARVEELWGLTSFFGYRTQTFVQAVNLLDRFLTIMKVGIRQSISFQHKQLCMFCVTGMKRAQPG